MWHGVSPGDPRRDRDELPRDHRCGSRDGRHPRRRRKGPPRESSHPGGRRPSGSRSPPDEHQGLHLGGGARRRPGAGSVAHRAGEPADVLLRDHHPVRVGIARARRGELVPDLRRQLFSSSIFLLRNKRPRIRSGVVTKETRGR